jgi:hypothetical protein
MKRIINIFLNIVFTGSLLMMFSCSEDFLTKQPPGTAAGSVMESEAGVEAMIVGTYSVLQGGSRFGAVIASDWTYGSACADDSYKGSSAGDQPTFNALEKYEALPNNGYMANRWSECYNGVARANTALTFLWNTQAGPKPIPAARATTMEGELKFLRAWYHFKATLVFENIPYIKTPTELGDVLPVEVPNSDPGWDGIEADLQYAIDNLPGDHINGEPGRATKYSAMGLKAWAYLEQNDLASAKPLLDAIIAGPFSLVDNFYDNYNMTTENNSESIFEIQAATSGSNNSSIEIAGGSAPQAGPAGIGWGFFQPSQNLIEAFQVDASGLPIIDPAARPAVASDMGVSSTEDWTPPTTTFDPRMDWTVMRRGVDFLGWGICEGASWIREQSNGGPYMQKKFMQTFEEQNSLVEGRGFNNGKNYRAITLGHVLLWRAEIAVSDGDLGMARDLVNQIRNRAKSSDVVMGKVSTTVFDGSPIVVDWTQPAANYDVQPYPATGYPFDNATNAMKAIQLEERLEFACQGFRFFDLRRWGIDDEVLNAYIQDDSQFRTFLVGKHYDPNEDDFWPLPQNQLDLQPGVLSQDPAYK